MTLHWLAAPCVSEFTDALSKWPKLLKIRGG